MANVFATKNGNWSDTTLWNTVGLPTTGDDVFTNTFTVVADISATVLSIRNSGASGITTGGSISITDASNGITLTTTSGTGFGVRDNNLIISSINSGNISTLSGALTFISGAGTATGIAHSGSGELRLNGTLNAALSASTAAIVNTGIGTFRHTGSFVSASGWGVFNNSSGTVFLNTDALSVGRLVLNGSTGTVNLTGNYRSSGFTDPLIRNTSSGTINIFGNCTGNTNNAGSNNGINNESTGVINITGTCSAGNQNTSDVAVNNAAGGTINIVGTCVGSAGWAVRNSGTGTINITGDCLRSGSTAAAVGNISSGIINITGTCSGDTVAPIGAVINSGIGTVFITGTCNGGSAANTFAFTNSSTGTVIHTGTVQASSSSPAIGMGGISQNTILSGPLLSSGLLQGSASSSGVNPCIALRWFPRDNVLTTFSLTMRGQNVVGSSRPERVMYITDSFNSGNPQQSDVRLGVSYGPGGSYIGTCAVPSANSVAFGVSVGSTTGTAYITQSDIAAALASASAVSLNQQTSTLTTPGSIGERLKIVSTVATTAQQLSDVLNSV